MFKKIKGFINSSELIYKTFLYGVVWLFGFLITWDWVLSSVLTIIIAISIEIKESYEKGKNDGREELTKEIENNQRGFIPLIALIVIGLVSIAGGTTLTISILKQKEESSKLAQEIERIRQESSLRDEENKKEVEKIQQEAIANTEKQRKESEALAKQIKNQERAPKPGLINLYNLTTTDIIKNNKKFIASIACETREGYSYGSGIVIGKSSFGKLLILTNYHVTKGFYSSAPNQPPCFIHTPISRHHFASPTMFPNVVSQKTMEAEDWSFLEVERPIPKKDAGLDFGFDEIEIVDQYQSFPQICSLNDMTAGSEIVALGYPTIGGGTFMDAPVSELTATEGIISSEPESWQHYFTSSAKIDHGNSGGGAFLKSNGCLAGMPTAASVGKIESLARIINLANLKEKYSSIFDYIQR